MNSNAASGFLAVLRIVRLCCVKLPDPPSGYGATAHLSTIFDLVGSCRLGRMKLAQPSITATSPLRKAAAASGLSQPSTPGGAYFAPWSINCCNALTPASPLISGFQSLVSSLDPVDQ